MKNNTQNKEVIFVPHGDDATRVREYVGGMKIDEWFIVPTDNIDIERMQQNYRKQGWNVIFRKHD